MHLEELALGDVSLGEGEEEGDVLHLLERHRRRVHLLDRSRLERVRQPDN